MDFGDFFVTSTEVGGRGSRWRSTWSILGLVVGAGLGGYLGYIASGMTGAVAGVSTGALLGWVLAMFLRGLVTLVLLMIVIGLIVWGWHSLFG